MSANPNDRMGVYKSLNAVPERYRLRQHSAAFEGRDVWDEYLTESLFEGYPDASEQFYESVERAGRRWKEHMADRGRHHALATPADVAAWCDTLLDRLTVGTAYDEYWVRIEGFYSWLQWHTDFPHVYQPPLIAVTENESAREIWNYKLTSSNRQGGAWE
jgi:hypothetical protein